MIKDLAISIRARLLIIAKAQNTDLNQIMVLFALERILYRLSQSIYADRFLLKGALLFTLWYKIPHRSTRDGDLLGFGPSDLESISQAFKEIAGLPIDDGIIFNPETVNVQEIRKASGNTGARVLIGSEMANARCKTQIDIGFGDAVTPGPVDAIYPTLIKDLPAPNLRTYPVYTVISEKLHAIALLGMTNSRIKDYFDLWIMLDREVLDIDILARAISATFIRRGMKVPSVFPIGLTHEFAQDSSRQILWLAFINKNNLPVMPLVDLVAMLQEALLPALIKASELQYELS